ncbi:glycerol-3-phosphate 1-O-acyltransferase PlsY [Paratissierella segnis]|mgnify:CR=1 FL=1|jgi:glycerol-3-phosphate acyltransferase PlsY|uniref:Glycerol-3-phosphate acyltransferase n=1 Tax=Paratissierella segnis TaxID=2763679 RepID=A0A926IKM7_9FIRM|nr:glycerol-3-phosphate 1-O-acyltransferase PlsY [Paratissierella segnis]MBC8588661.1 glycerol-3-phosphate 1-O-acyltransferase PlsY [Paratissierella segnis]
MKFVIIGIISYLIGSFSSAFFLGKAIKKIDIRVHGSGNSGTTNAIRVMGFRMGVLTFLIDFAKGAIAVLIGFYLEGYNGGLLGGICAVLGHDYPIYIRFKGGKGVATSIGALAILDFPMALISVIIGLIVGFFTKYVSLGSIVFFVLNPFISIIINNPNNRYLTLTTVFLGLLGICRHKSNIERLIRGNENKIGR